MGIDACHRLQRCLCVVAVVVEGGVVDVHELFAALRGHAARSEVGNDVTRRASSCYAEELTAPSEPSAEAEGAVVAVAACTELESLQQVDWHMGEGDQIALVLPAAFEVTLVGLQRVDRLDILAASKCSQVSTARGFPHFIRKTVLKGNEDLKLLVRIHVVFDRPRHYGHTVRVRCKHQRVRCVFDEIVRSCYTLSRRSVQAERPIRTRTVRRGRRVDGIAGIEVLT